MARNRTPSTAKAQQGSTAAQGNGHATSEHPFGSQDWLNGSLAVPKKAVDSLLEIQRHWLSTASLGTETLALELKELQQAKDPVEFVSAQFSLANQQLEIFTSQVASLMQQLYDAQLLWIGQWDEKSEAATATPASAQPTQQALGALGRVQDEWLKVTQSWIDSLSAVSQAR